MQRKIGVTADQMFSIAEWPRLSALCSPVLTQLHPKAIFRGNDPAEDRGGRGYLLSLRVIEKS